ncbi:MAG: hypothetical protein VX726_10210 [Planctomycetota bacterium]|nr:hypothetical protein [Planctomycetota bacterium]
MTLDGSSVDPSLGGLDFTMFDSIHTDRRPRWWGGRPGAAIDSSLA